MRGSTAPVDGLRLGVVVISYRRPAVLWECLCALGRQRVPPSIVLLVAQGYEPRFLASLRKRFRDSLEIRIVTREEGIGVSAARNVALDALDPMPEVVAFIDDDVVIPISWSENLLRHYEENPKLGGLGGRVLRVGDRAGVLRSWFRRVAGFAAGRFCVGVSGFHFEPARRQVGLVRADWLSGCNMSFRSAVFEDVGRFDEGFGTYGFEDVDFCLSVRCAGWALRASDTVQVQHRESSVNRPPAADRIEATESMRWRLIQKHSSRRILQKVAYATVFGRRVLGRSIIALRKGDNAAVLAAIRGAGRGWRRYGRR